MLLTATSSTTSNVVSSTVDAVEKTGANEAVMNNLPIIGVVAGVFILGLVSVLAILNYKNKKKLLAIEAKKLKMK